VKLLHYLGKVEPWCLPDPLLGVEPRSSHRKHKVRQGFPPPGSRQKLSIHLCAIEIQGEDEWEVEST